MKSWAQPMLPALAKPNPKKRAISYSKTILRSPTAYEAHTQILIRGVHATDSELFVNKNGSTCTEVLFDHWSSSFQFMCRSPLHLLFHSFILWHFTFPPFVFCFFLPCLDCLPSPRVFLLCPANPSEVNLCTLFKSTHCPPSCLACHVTPYTFPSIEQAFFIIFIICCCFFVFVLFGCFFLQLMKTDCCSSYSFKRKKIGTKSTTSSL